MDVTAYYATHFRDGMVDLSRSSADPLPLTSNFEEVPWSSVRPPGGIADLRAAVARCCYRTLVPDDILLCSGASEALVACALTLASPGRSAVALPGSYPSFTRTLRVLRARRFRSFERCREPTCALATNPIAPSGARLDVGAFVDRAIAAGSVPIVDEVHRHIVLDRGDAPDAAADLHQDAISIGDMSKPLGLGGLRVGWVATRNRTLRARVERTLQLITGGPSVLADIAGLSALEAFERHVQKQRQGALCNAPKVYRELQRAEWSFTPPALGLTFVARPPRPLGNAALERAREAGLFLIPCSALDVPGPDSGLRISVLADPRCLRHGIQLLTTRWRSCPA